MAELGDVITGLATVRLSQAGYQTNISPPAIIIGKGVQISILDFSRIIVPLRAGSRVMTIHLALREQFGGERLRSEDYVPYPMRS